jgi:hypothetical protein
MWQFILRSSSNHLMPCPLARAATSSLASDISQPTQSASTDSDPFSSLDSNDSLANVAAKVSTSNREVALDRIPEAVEEEASTKSALFPPSPSISARSSPGYETASPIADDDGDGCSSREASPAANRRIIPYRSNVEPYDIATQQSSTLLFTPNVRKRFGRTSESRENTIVVDEDTAHRLTRPTRQRLHII